MRSPISSASPCASTPPKAPCASRATAVSATANALIAKRAGVKVLVLTHLLDQIDQPSVREQIVHEIRQVFDGKVIWGQDLMRLGLSGAAVGSIETRQG